MDIHPYRLGFAVKVLGAGGLATSDTRRWQSGPHLSRSVELLDTVFDRLDAIDVRVYRLSSSTIPYGTHPDLPHLDYRRQLGEAADHVAALGAKARRLGLRLSTHPGQYTVLNAVDEEVARKAALDLEQDAALFDAMGLGPEAAIVLHVGGVYGDRAAALDRWARRYEALSASARARLAVEHDETSFDAADVLELHRQTGVRVVFDLHHHRCNPGSLEAGEALAAASSTWGAVRQKAHLSSPRTELRAVGRGPTAKLLPPLLDQHADFATPWDLAELLRLARGPLDVVVEAKAKDLAVLWLRDRLARVAPELSAAEERRAGRAPRRRAGAATSPARTPAGSSRARATRRRR